MKRIGIVTNIGNNFGNRLQNYALQTVLLDFGFIPETVSFARRNRIIIALKVLLKEIISTVIPKYKNNTWERFDFHIAWSAFLASDRGINDAYDYFIAGSDQIWNPNFWFTSDREFLSFASNEKKIAYAASIGLDELPEEYQAQYRNRLISFKAVSVREDAAAEIIANLGLLKPPVVLDPTMLLTETAWRKVIVMSRLHLNNRFVVKYFLGKCSEETDRMIRDKAREMGTEVVDIMDISSPMHYRIGPPEFVYLFANSEAVFTDSFHGSVFSILFHKPLSVFDRPYEEGAGKMTSRIDTLLGIFGLGQNRVRLAAECTSMVMDWNHDIVDRILDKKRNESLSFLRKALEIE